MGKRERPSIDRDRARDSHDRSRRGRPFSRRLAQSRLAWLSTILLVTLRPRLHSPEVAFGYSGLRGLVWSREGPRFQADRARRTKVALGLAAGNQEWGAPAPAPTLEGRLQLLKLPTRFIGGAYFLLMLSVPPADAFRAVNKAPDEFPRANLTLLLDSGLTAAVMLTSDVCKDLKLAMGGEGAFSSGVGATGSSLDMQQVRVEGAALVDKEARCPLDPMAGVVVDNFPQLSIAGEVGIALQGMLGQGFMDQYDLELDARTERVRAFPRASLPPLAADGDWRQLEALGMPGRLQGLLLTVPGCLEPVVGLVDTGASHTVLNRQAAYVLGLRVDEDVPRRVRGIGLDNSVLEMPLLSLANITLSSARHVTITPHEPGGGANPVEGQRSWRFRARIKGPIATFPEAVDVGIGDIGLFQELLSQPQDTIGDFDGPVALLGQDLMTQMPLRYSAARGTLWFRHD
mmetsp:Transcript_5340/g.9544  ORF Transcript_5340/g.9544 Transcript_5340/m.9544 type:complete len:459 (+) Transcript_5340:39-1415(+)